MNRFKYIWDSLDVFNKQKEHGYGEQVDKLIDKVQDIDNKILYGDPEKREERKQEKRNILRVINGIQKWQAEFHATGQGSENETPVGDAQFPDYSEIPIPNLTSAQVNSEIDRVMTEIQTPGIGKRYKELEDRLMALKKQQRKNRRSNESLDRISRARQLRS